MDSIGFLNAIFGDAIGDGRKLIVWTHPDKKTQQFADVAAAVAYGITRAKDSNVYFGLSLMSGVTEGRGKYENAAAIGCLWADIDIAGMAHKKKNLPTDMRSAQTVLDRVGLAPSMLIHSGHGLQAYWLLKEPWIFETDQERARAAELASRWVGTVRAVSAAMEFDCDSVGDLPRVFRLPGTFNHKDPTRSVEVRIIEVKEELRYIPDDFDQFLIAPEFEPPAPGQKIDKAKLAPVMVGAVMLDAAAEPPALKLLALLENDVKFKRAWKRTRTDLPDQSASSYDMSLANLAVLAGWSDQEIANLVIAWRREHGEDMGKAMRRDYIQRTIGKARVSQKQEAAVGDLAKVATEIAADESSPAADVAAKRKSLLERLSKLLGIGIVRWVQHGRENGRYSMQLADNLWVRMGTVESILSASKFKAHVYEACGKVLSPVKPKDWDDVLRCLSACVEFVENEEASSAYQAEHWVQSYLSDHPAADGDDWKEAAVENQPFVKDAKLHIHAHELRKHMRVMQHENQVTHVELCDSLRLSGFARGSTPIRMDDEVINRSFWITANVARFIRVRQPQIAGGSQT